MIKKITLLFFALCTSVITAQSISMTDAGFFATGNNATYNTIFTAALTGDGVENEWTCSNSGNQYYRFG